MASSLLIFTPRNPNLQPSNPLSSSFSQTSKKFTQLGFHHRNPLIRSSADGSYFSHNNEQVEQSEYPKPTEIPWSKELANTVHLIGNVGAPIQFKNLDSGKILAWTRLGVRKSPTETTWVNLTFWDELAHTAVQHVEKGQQIYVLGRLVSDTIQGDDEKTQTYYKVVVKQLNFIEKGVYQEKNAGQTANYGVTTGASTQELWQAYFANPTVWWDNRKTKDEEDEDEANEEEGGGLSKSGKELKKLLGRQGGMNDSDAEEDDDDDEHVSMSPVLAPKQKVAPKEKPVDNSPSKTLPSGSARGTPSASKSSKSKRKSTGDDSKSGNSAPSEKVKTENRINDILPFAQESKPSVKDGSAASSKNGAPSKGSSSSSTKTASTPSAGPVTEDEIRAVLLQKAPVTTQDLVAKFRARLKTPEKYILGRKAKLS